MPDPAPPSEPVRPTLAQVAAQAGVSEITVSRVMRGGTGVAPRTVARVEAAAAALGYVRNRLAGSLAGGPSNQVGVILPSLANVVFPDVLRGLERGLEAAEFHPVLGVSGYDPAREEKLIAGLLAWRPAAMVIAPAALTQGARRMLAAAGLPVVEIMEADCEPVDMAVGLSQRQAGKAMAWYLMGRGHARFGFVGHDLTRDRRAAARLAGFEAALAEGGRALAASLTLPEPSSVAAGRRGMEALLARPGPRPDVVYFSNDDMAAGGAFHCLSAGLAMPGDIGIAGFNGLELGQALPAPLTTIASHRERIGAEAARLVLDRLAGAETPRIVDTGFTLIEGASA